MTGTKIELGPSGEAVAANVHRLRTEQRLTWTELSKLLSDGGRPITPVSVRRIESGDRRVDADDLVALAVVLNVGPATLLLPPDVEGERDPVRITGMLKKVPVGWVWEWIRSNRPLPPSTADRDRLKFMMLANPAWSDAERVFVIMNGKTARLKAKKEDDQ